MAKLDELTEIGQSVWLDYIRRSFIISGELGELIGKGLRGVISNPAIFAWAISDSADYDGAMKLLLEQGKQDIEIYEDMVFDDIRKTADLLLLVYKNTDGIDGYVSLEINPSLAFDTDGTVFEARRLFSILGRPNVMIKIPATNEGIPAIQTLIEEGININATFIFSLAQYQAVSNAYINGLERSQKANDDLLKVASVASISINSLDTIVDLALEESGHTQLSGKFAIANAKEIYRHFLETLTWDTWKRIADQGARPQRLLWDSAGVKNPSYTDTLYMDSLIGRFTVSGVPPATLQAFLDHGKVSENLEDGFDEAHAYYEGLSDLGIDIGLITRQLQKDSIAALSVTFDGLITSIGEKRKYLRAGRQNASFGLGRYEEVFERSMKGLKDNRVMSRIWSHDHTVWKTDPVGIKDRLGWLHSPEIMTGTIKRLKYFVQDVLSDEYTHALLLGMGGSSMAPDVFQKIFGVKEGYLNLNVLDSTDPGAVMAQADRLDPAKTLFIVSTKSGTTVETLSFFKFFYNRVAAVVGEQDAGRHFIAITDSGTPLAELAERRHFRQSFINDPNIGGRYSVLSYFGLVPAALIGVNIGTLLNRAMAMVCNCDSCNFMAEGNNNCAKLGVAIGELTKAGREKLTFVLSPEIESFSDWIEQLIAESTGKEGKGILPVTGELIGSSESYGKDRTFVQISLKGHDTQDVAIDELERSGQSVIRLSLRDSYDLGGQFFLWEMAVAVAGHCLGINPFDQPNVEAAKVLAREIVAEYKEKGSLPIESPWLEDADITVYGEEQGKTPEEALISFLSRAMPGAYVSIQVYVKPTVETYAAMQKFRTRLRDRFRMATTFGYGPRFLHSTGQLHKGDSGKGFFIQFTVDDQQDVPIPEEAGSSISSMTFGVLKAAQASGDRKALLNAGRQVIRFHLKGDVIQGVNRLSEAFV